MTARADDRERRARGQRADEAIDALVRRQPADEEDPAASFPPIRPVAPAVHAAVDDPRASGRRAELARGVGRDRQEAVEEPRQEPRPHTALEAVVRDDRRAAASAGEQRRHPAGCAAQVVGMDELRAGQRRRQPWRDGMRGVPEERDRAQDAHHETVRLPDPRGRAERDELALGAAGEGAGELERVALPAAEDPALAERRRRHVNHSHLVLCLVTLGDPTRLTGGYLYHLRMAQAAPRHGARIVFLSFPERRFPLPALAARRVFARAAALGAHAVLLDSIAAAFAGPWLAARPPQGALIGVLHQTPGGVDNGRLRAALQTPLDRLAYRRTRLLLVASDLLAEQLAADGIDRRRIHVIPPGRDLVSAPAAPVGDLRRGRRAAFLCAANWIDRKGILELLEAVARLGPEAATLHLAGDDRADAAYAARVRRRLSEPDVSERVVVHGPLRPERLAALYSAADAFVLPAFREPYGTVWGEAMACGLPVVGWRAGNLPYLADDGREGLLVAPGDVGGLARALGALAADEELRRRLGRAARARASAYPTWEESATAFFGAIRGAVDGG
jgi:glycosyltransferase involved in cell wall biosynthesis